MHGWICPSCGAAHGPFTWSCPHCPPRMMPASNTAPQIVVTACPYCHLPMAQCRGHNICRASA